MRRAEKRLRPSLAFSYWRSETDLLPERPSFQVDLGLRVFFLIFGVIFSQRVCTVFSFSQTECVVLLPASLFFLLSVVKKALLESFFRFQRPFMAFLDLSGWDV